MKILSSDTTTKSGVMILLNLQSKVLIPKAIDSIDKLYEQWCGIKRGENEAIEEYTARALTFQSELKGTTKEINKEELVRKWRQGLGQGMDEINTALDNLRIPLPQWSSIHPMFQLMRKQDKFSQPSIIITLDNLLKRNQEKGANVTLINAT